jgi:Xaa-Pro aminopeptidase
MLTLHSMLLVGPYDWDPAALPREEFTERLAAFWQRMPAGCKGLVVFGDSRSHAELAYLTNFVPKVRHAMALVPRRGDPVVLIPGSRAQFPVMKRLTWTEHLELLTDAGKAVQDWMAKLETDGAGLALAGGDAMRPALRESLVQAFGGPPFDATPVLRELMQRKRPRELEALRGACDMLDAAHKALVAAHRSGATVTSALLEAEHAAHRAGAQDVRSLFSVDGGRTLRPFTAPLPDKAETLQCYVAARHRGYWADGMLTSGRNAALDRAGAALRSLIAACRPGAVAGELAARVDAALKPLGRHPLTAREYGNAVGLSLDGPPVLSAGGDQRLDEGGVYSLRVGVSNGPAHGLASALVAVQASGPQVLWSSEPGGR